MRMQSLNALFQILAQILRFNTKVIDAFPASPTVTLASFRVGLYVAPIYLLQSLLHLLRGTPEHNPAAFLAVEVLTYVIGWALFPVVLLALAPRLGWGDRVLRYITVYNWFQVAVALALLPFILLNGLNILPQEGAQLLMMITATAIMVYSWFIARHSLKVPGLTATGCVVLDLLLSVFVNGVLPSLFGG